MNKETEQAVFDFIDNLGIEHTTFHHDEASTMDVCEVIEQQLGVPICKNLFLCNRQQTQYYLLMMPGDKPFKTKYISSQLGCARLSFADEGRMEELLHVKPGSVSIMGLIFDEKNCVRLVIDKDLLQYDHLGCHPCLNTATIKISLYDLLEVYLPAIHHDYTLVELPKE